MTADDAGTVISDVARDYLRLHLTTEVGPIRLRKLRERFGTLEAVLSSSSAELERVEGIGQKIAGSVLRSRRSDTINVEIDRAATCGVRILCLEDCDYPRPLLSIPDAPLCLYVRGQLRPPDAVALAIVGTRRCSHYGREQALRFGELLGRAGFAVVSGLARGIDCEAHRGALRVDGRTIAVLGNGLATIYPPEHKAQAEEIASHGALISEYAMDAAPERGNFPRRNRIIVGLTLGVLVIEAGNRSGALISARLANEYNREVFAIPGRVDRPDLSAGVNGLIRDGQAKLVTGLEDVLDELGDVGRIMARQDDAPDDRGEAGSEEVARTGLELPAEEQAVLNALAQEADEVDTISSTARLDSARVMTSLTSLQLKGLVQRLPGNRFARRGRGPAT